MEQEELIGLIKKYLEDIATAEERKEILKWYRSMNHDRIEIPLEDVLEKEEMKNRMRGKLEQYIAQNRSVQKKNSISLGCGSSNYFIACLW